MEEHKLRKAFSFHSRNANAERFVQYASAVFQHKEIDVKVDRLDGSMRMEDRKAKLDAFAGSRSKAVIANAKCLQEGVDVHGCVEVRAEVAVLWDAFPVDLEGVLPVEHLRELLHQLWICGVLTLGFHIHRRL